MIRSCKIAVRLSGDQMKRISESIALSKDWCGRPLKLSAWIRKALMDAVAMYSSDVPPAKRPTKRHDRLQTSDKSDRPVAVKALKKKGG